MVINKEELAKACAEHSEALRKERHGDQFAADLLAQAASALKEVTNNHG